jgi:hypothetical protein
MKKAPNACAEMRPEYDFASMKGGVRGKYAQRLRAGSVMVVLEPEVADAFPSDLAVNRALRAVLSVASLVAKSSRSQRAAGAKRGRRRTISSKR